MSKTHQSAFLTSIQTGFVYAVVMFAAGFLLGTMRVLVLVPTIGELNAVLVELPLMFGAAWFVSLTLQRRAGLLADLLASFIIGLSYCFVLICFEIVLWLVMGNTLLSLIQHWLTLAGALGLTGQIMTGGFPVLRSLLLHTHSSN